MNKLIFLALIMGSLLGNVAPVLASETTKKQDDLITSLSDTLLGLLGGTILSGSVFTVLSCLENKDRDFVNKKLKEYRSFSRNAHVIYDEMWLKILLIEQETVSIKESLSNFHYLLLSFDSEIERIQFWSNEANDWSEGTRRLSKKIVVKNIHKSSLIEVDLAKGLYDQEELTLEEFKTRLEEQWKKIGEEYQKLIDKKEEIVDSTDEEETIVERSNRENDSLPSSSQGIPRGCQGCEHLYGQVEEGRLLVCAMHPYGQEYCPDYSLDYSAFFSDRDVAKIKEWNEEFPNSKQGFQALCQGMATSNIDAIFAAVNQINVSINSQPISYVQSSTEKLVDDYLSLLKKEPMEVFPIGSEFREAVKKMDAQSSYYSALLNLRDKAKKQLIGDELYQVHHQTLDRVWNTYAKSRASFEQILEEHDLLNGYEEWRELL